MQHVVAYYISLWLENRDLLAADLGLCVCNRGIPGTVMTPLQNLLCQIWSSQFVKTLSYAHTTSTFSPENQTTVHV